MTQLKMLQLDDTESQGNSLHSNAYLSEKHVRHYLFLHLA